MTPALGSQQSGPQPRRSQPAGAQPPGPPVADGRAPRTKAPRRRSRDGAPAAPAVPAPAARTSQPAGVRPAVTRQTVRRFDLWTVLKVSLSFYLAALVALLLAFVVLWLVASSFGVVSSVEDFMTSLLSTKDFTFLSTRLLLGMTLVGLVLVTLLTLITVIAAGFYNLFAETIGGVEVILVEDRPGEGS